MGKKGQEIVSKAGLDVKKLVQKLNKAYCDEWLAHIQYYSGAQIAVGIPRENVVAEMKEHAADELKHAGMLAERIIQLGGTPVIDPKEWFKLTNCGYDAPVNPDVNVLLKQNIEAERCAIAVYHQLLEEVRGKDFITGNMIRKIMEDEVEHEQDLEDIVNDIKAFRK